MKNLEFWVDETDRIHKAGTADLANIQEVYVNENFVRITFVNGAVVQRHIEGTTVKIY